MALNTRWLAIGTAAALGLVAVAVLPPRVCDGNFGPVIGGMCFTFHYRGDAHESVATGTRNQLREQLRRRALADSLAARRDGWRLTSGNMTVHFEAPLTADSARAFLALAEREVALFPGAATGPAVRLVLLSDPRRFADSEAEDGRRVAFWREFTRFAVGGVGGACVVVVDMARGQGARHLLRQQRPALLDWCALYGRFGPPGDAIRRWAASAFMPAWRDPTSLAELMELAGEQARGAVNDHEMRACQAGSTPACLEVLGSGSGEPYRMFASRRASRDFLAWLLATGADGQFARFWGSKGSLTEALAEGYGTRAPTIMQEWARARYEAPARQRMAEPRQLLAGAVWFSLAMVAAFVAMQRRQAR